MVDMAAHGGGGGENNPPSYNAYYMPRENGTTLANVKQSCRALQSINPVVPSNRSIPTAPMDIIGGSASTRKPTLLIHPRGEPEQVEEEAARHSRGGTCKMKMPVCR